jgi:hypothetical protein
MLHDAIFADCWLECLLWKSEFEKTSNVDVIALVRLQSFLEASAIAGTRPQTAN